MPPDTVMQLSDVVRTFGGGRKLLGGHAPAVHAVRGVSLAVAKGETLGVVGESGCGKSTLARMMVGLDAPTDGTIRIASEGGPITPGASRAETARAIQYVFQDNSAALNPRKTIAAALDVPLRHLTTLDAAARKARAAELMELVNLDPSFLERYPHELSGGQAQRVGIARALAADPALLVLDEPVSGLDVSMQAQVLNLLADLKHRLGLTFVFISHDLSVVEAVSDRVAILYFGKIAEVGPVRTVFAKPQHHYTALLLRSVPALGRALDVAEDEDMQLPDPYDPPQGCAFASRCPAAQDICRKEQPPFQSHGDNPCHTSACHFPL